MAYYLHTVISITAAVYCLITLFSFFAEKRTQKKYITTFVAACLQSGAELIITFALSKYIYGRAAAIFISASVTMFLLFDIRYSKSLILSSFYCTIGFITEFITIIVLGNVFPLITGNVLDLSESSTLNIVVIISKILLFVIILLIGKLFSHKKLYMLTSKECWTLFAISFITTVSLTALVLDIDLINHPTSQTSLLIATTGMLAINFIIYYLVNTIIKRELKLRDDIVFRERVKNETAMYHSISEHLEKQRRIAHEYKNQIAAMSALAAAGQYSDLKEYIQKSETALKLNMNTIDTNNVIVNAVVNIKYHEAVDKGIVFVVKINDLSNLNIRDEDVIVILSNLLNNAIEACEKCNEKIIRFKFIAEKEHTIISVKNNIMSKPVIENGIFITTKNAETGEHGLGMRNVIETIERYNGRYVIDYDDETFQFSILIPFLS